MRRLAEACGSYYKAIKTLNPWIKGQALPPGTYRLKTAQGYGEPLPWRPTAGGSWGRK